MEIFWKPHDIPPKVKTILTSDILFVLIYVLILNHIFYLMLNVETYQNRVHQKGRRLMEKINIKKSQNLILRTIIRRIFLRLVKIYE